MPLQLFNKKVGIVVAIQQVEAILAYGAYLGAILINVSLGDEYLYGIV